MTGLILIVGSNGCPDVKNAIRFARAEAEEYAKIKVKTCTDKKLYTELVESMATVHGVTDLPEKWPDKHPTIYEIELNKGEGCILADQAFPSGCSKEDIHEMFLSLDIHVNS